jgi:hypothetical protein
MNKIITIINLISLIIVLVAGIISGCEQGG